MSEAEIARVMDGMPYGLYIIGSALDGDVNGMMADWVMQVSFRPRLIALALENDARTLRNLRSEGAFTVNALSQDRDSMELAAKFAQPYYGSKIEGRTRTAAEEVHHKLEGIKHTKTAGGRPVLDSAMAWLECEVEQLIPTGDHTLAIARVVDGKVVREGDALTSSYTGWNYSG
jgi:flavin reductase (DIM6/NTAB) family NADH-FMN oxidoreductase RutF